MRSLALLLLLLGVLVYLLPSYRSLLPDLPLNDPNAQLLGGFLGGMGIIALVFSWRAP